MTKVAFKVFGCKVNQLEIQALRNLMIYQHCTMTEDLRDADILFVGSCTVTKKAEQKVLKFIRKAMREQPEIKVEIMGCFLPSIQEKLLHCENQIKFINNTKKFEYLSSATPNITGLSGHTRAFLKIQEGCNSYCSYCIIPHLRKNLHSRSISETIDQVKNNIEAGKKEIVLVGIHIGLWRSQKNEQLSVLVNELLKIDGDWRLRLSSIEITEVDDELIDLIRGNNKLVEHLHIPLQSGSTQILNSMNRNYSKKYFLDKISRIRGKVELSGISTDVMIGFPGETEQDFEDTFEVVKTSEFMRMHIFPYSDRPGTPAASLPDKVAKNIVKKREERLSNLGLHLKHKFAEKFIGSEVEILVERFTDEGAVGYTREYMSAIIQKTENILVNTLIKKKVIGVKDDGILILGSF